MAIHEKHMKPKKMPAGMPRMPVPPKQAPGKPAMPGKEMGMAMKGAGRLGKGQGMAKRKK